MPFKFGNTYKEDCDVCIDDFKSNTRKRDNEVRDIRTHTINTRRMMPTTSDKITTTRLNEYRDRNPTGKVLLGKANKQKMAKNILKNAKNIEKVMKNN